MQDKPQSHRLRRGRVPIPSQIYHITTTTMGREPVFSGLAAGRRLIGVLRETELRADARTLAFVLMPDHLHWLMQLGEMSQLSRVVHQVKAVSAHRLGRSLWQPGFHDHALRREEDVQQIARYIVSNPVRAGLVGRVEDWPHWDVVWL